MFDESCTHSFELEYILRLIEHGGLEGLGHISEPLVKGAARELCEQAEQRDILERHLHNRGYVSGRVTSRLPGRYDLEYGHDHCPAVTFLIVLDGPVSQAQRCVQSVLEGTNYENYEVLLLNPGTTDAACVQWLGAVEQLAAPNLRVLHFAAELGKEALLNLAVVQSLGEYLLLLDVHAQVIERDWLLQLLNHAMRPEVGAVGAKFTDARGRVRGGGLMLGLSAAVTAPFDGMPADAAGYLNRLEVDQNYSALASQCLMIAKDLFLSVGGFDEQMTALAHVDLCLKLKQAGYLNVWTPRAHLLIHDWPSSSVTTQEQDSLSARWSPVIANDPASNPNLQAGREGLGFSYTDASISWRPLATLKSVPTLLVYPDPGVESTDRLESPFSALSARGWVQGALLERWLDSGKLQRMAPDSIIVQGTVDPMRLAALGRIKRFSDSFTVCDLSRYLPACPRRGPFSRATPEELFALMRLGIETVDRVLVPTAFMAQVFEGFNADIRVLPDRLSDQWRGLVGERCRDAKPRVGWVGELHDLDDLALIGETVKALADEVHWVILGSCPEPLRAFVHEVHASVLPDHYPQKLASLGLDLAVVPLVDTLFNRCRGHRRLLEFGACGVPVICSAIEAHQGELPVKRVNDSNSAWMEAVRLHAREREAMAQLGDYLRDHVLRHWMLDEDALHQWRDHWIGDRRK